MMYFMISDHLIPLVLVATTYIWTLRAHQLTEVIYIVNYQAARQGISLRFKIK